jgi:isoquinoline 1-oxidoreductase subunit alpha
MPINVQINGEKREIDLPPDTPLLWTIRDHLGLTGTKFGCGMSLCGACTVHVEGQAVRSCMLPLSSVAGKAVTTIEGLQSKEGGAVKAAWEQLAVVQCGYCQSGQIMAATALLSANPNPADDAINSAMSGNLCRCSTYVRIRAAIKAAAASLS